MDENVTVQIFFGTNSLRSHFHLIDLYLRNYSNLSLMMADFSSSDCGKNNYKVRTPSSSR